MRMTTVTPEALAAMDGHSEEGAIELADAECDVLAYACLVAVMAAEARAHHRSEAKLRTAAGGATPVVTSAGALVTGVRALGVRRIAMIAPYAPGLTATVISYLGDAGIEVVDSISLGVTDNCAVGRLDPHHLVPLTDRLDLTDAEAVVVSACVQLPSLAAVQAVQERTGLPALSAATATTRALLEALDLDPVIPGGGALLA
jgi:maleate isomerase